MKVHRVGVTTCDSQVFENKQNLLLESTRQFGDLISSNENVLVLFCAPYAENCQNFYPEYHAAGDLLSFESPKMVMGSVDCSEDSNTELCIRED